jgi:hypothetical protein
MAFYTNLLELNFVVLAGIKVGIKMAENYAEN